MNTADAIALARRLKAEGPKLGDTKHDYREALIALLDNGDAVMAPDFETAIKIVAAGMCSQGKFYLEMAVDPETKQIGYQAAPFAAAGDWRLATELPDVSGEYLTWTMTPRGSVFEVLYFDEGKWRRPKSSSVEECTIHCWAELNAPTMVDVGRTMTSL